MCLSSSLLIHHPKFLSLKTLRQKVSVYFYCLYLSMYLCVILSILSTHPTLLYPFKIPTEPLPDSPDSPQPSPQDKQVHSPVSSFGDNCPVESSGEDNTLDDLQPTSDGYTSDHIAENPTSTSN